MGLLPASAFNNILSNLGYILLGLLFLLIILQREIHYNRALMRSDTNALVRDAPAAFAGADPRAWDRGEPREGLPGVPARLGAATQGAAGDG